MSAILLNARPASSSEVPLLPNVAVIVGTRPEAIKLAPVILELRRRELSTVSVVLTQQQESLPEEALACFGLQPDVLLKAPIRRTLPEAFGWIASEVGNLLRESYDICIVQGDTTSAAAAAVAAFQEGVPVVHVEAGLRTGDLSAPFPEEGNRRLISAVATLHAAPSADARENLLREGVSDRHIVVTGNPVVDALLEIHRSTGELRVERPFVLVTAHRRENWGANVALIAAAVASLAKEHGEYEFVVVDHPNPHAREGWDRQSLPKNVTRVPPVNYEDFISLLAAASIALSDSGGIQEEGPSLGTPVVVLRDSTERPEALRSGHNVLVPPDDIGAIVETARLMLDRGPSAEPNPFGDGSAGVRIVAALERLWP